MLATLAYHSALETHTRAKVYDVPPPVNVQAVAARLKGAENSERRPILPGGQRTIDSYFDGQPTVEKRPTATILKIRAYLKNKNVKGRYLTGEELLQTITYTSAYDQVLRKTVFVEVPNIPVSLAQFA